MTESSNDYNDFNSLPEGFLRAAGGGELEIIKAICEDEESKTLNLSDGIHNALQFREFEVAEYLVSQGVKIPIICMHEALLFKHLEVVEYLFNKKIEYNYKLYSKDQNQESLFGVVMMLNNKNINIKTYNKLINITVDLINIGDNTDDIINHDLLTTSIIINLLNNGLQIEKIKSHHLYHKFKTIINNINSAISLTLSNHIIPDIISIITTFTSL
jgi:hypothetical protein